MTCHNASTVTMPMTPRMIRRRRSRLRRASPKANSLSPVAIGAAWVVEAAVVGAIASMSARELLQGEIENVRKGLELWTELAALHHGRADESPPFLRLSLGQAGGGI